MEWAPLGLIAAISLLIAALNATSQIMEAQTGGAPIDPRAAWLFELSSVVMVSALAPFVGWMMWQVPPPREMEVPACGRVIALHLLAAVIYSVAHIAGMVAIRTVGYAAVGSTYHFDYLGDCALPFFYELRKDVLTYLVIAGGYWVWGYWLAQQAAKKLVKAPAAAAPDTRIEIRDGGRVILLEPAQIGWIEAAGNYVEIHVGGTAHLARGTLAAFEERLARRGFLRVHRSRLVNRARVKAFKPTPSGDLEITLDDGRVIGGSRRFRNALESV